MRVSILLDREKHRKKIIMVSAYHPTSAILETAKNARGFVRENKKTMWRLWTPVIPYMVAIAVLGTLVEFFLGDNLFMAILLRGAETVIVMTLAISWHRLVIQGAQAAPMNPFRWTRNETVFMAMAFGLSVAYVALVLLIGVVAVLLGLPKIIQSLLLMTGLLALAYASLRFSFFFPARAANRPLTLAQAYALSRGYVWRMFWASVMAALPTMLLLVVAGIAIGMVIGLVAAVLPVPGAVLILTFVLMLPLQLYFTPVLTALGVTVLSNYYRLATEQPD